jgi:hypothetical protein
MSYKRQPVTLIAREGYSDYVAMGDISSTLSSIGGGLYGVVTGAARSEGEAEAYRQLALQQQKSSTPEWLLPVAIGGVGLVAVILLMRRRK